MSEEPHFAPPRGRGDSRLTVDGVQLTVDVTNAAPEEIPADARATAVPRRIRCSARLLLVASICVVAAVAGLKFASNGWDGSGSIGGFAAWGMASASSQPASNEAATPSPSTAAPVSPEPRPSPSDAVAGSAATSSAPLTASVVPPTASSAAHSPIGSASASSEPLSGTVHAFDLPIRFMSTSVAGFPVTVMTYGRDDSDGGRGMAADLASQQLAELLPLTPRVLNATPGSTLLLTLRNELPGNRPPPPAVAAALEGRGSVADAEAAWSACWHKAELEHEVAALRRVMRQLQSRMAESGGSPAPVPAPESPQGGMQDGHGGHGLSTVDATLAAVAANNGHAFRSSNVHTHGLQVSPAEDNPFALVAPGEAAVRRIALPEDHPSGLFWLHPHSHASAAVQLGQGMAAVLRVYGEFDRAMEGAGLRELVLPVTQITLFSLQGDAEPGRDAAAAAAAARAAAARMTQRQMLEQAVSGRRLPWAVSPTPAFSPASSAYGWDPVPLACPGPLLASAPAAGSGAGSASSSGGSGSGSSGGVRFWGFDLQAILVGGVPVALYDGRLARPLPGEDGFINSQAYHWVITGQTPVRPLRYGEMAWLRVVNGLPEAPMPLTLDQGDRFGLLLLAIDGLALAAPLPIRDGLPFADPGGDDVRGYLLPPGGRYDLALVAPPRPPVVTPFVPQDVLERGETVQLWAARYVGCRDRPDCPVHPSFPIATFQLPPLGMGARGRPSEAMRSAVDPPMALPKLPVPATPRMAPIADGDVQQRRVFVLSQRVNGSEASAGNANRGHDPASLNGAGFFINNRTHSPGRVDVSVPFGSVEEWVIENPMPAHDHPWHVHSTPFLVVGLQDMTTGAQHLLQPYWADTMWVPQGKRAITRLRFSQFRGRSVAHCHIAPHEAAGMMIVYEVV